MFSELCCQFAFFQELQDACGRWLLPEECSAEDMINLMVLEQFIKMASLPLREVVLMALATVILERKVLGLEVGLTVPNSEWVAMLQLEFSNVFSPLPGCTNFIEHRIEMPQGYWNTATPIVCPNTEKNMVQDELQVVLNMEESHTD